MAQLLGKQDRIESLRNDVIDLQSVVIDILSRVGSVPFRSWRSPDQIACDLDVPALLEIHDFSESTEENQLSHIVLMELMIDRLLLLLQLMGNFLDQMSSSNKKGASAQTSKSAGPICKKYWNKLLQLYNAFNQVSAENKSKTRKISELEHAITKTSNGQSHIVPEQSLPTEQFSQLSSRLSGTQSKSSFVNLGHDEYNKATQTIETAFVPCDSCSLTQKGLRDAGDKIINVCQTFSLQSSIEKHKAKVTHVDWMSGNDVVRWVAEQNKDLLNIEKHASQLIGTVDPLKQMIADEKKRNKEMEESFSKCKEEAKRERETSSIMRKQYEGKLKELENSKMAAITNIEKQKSEVIEGKCKVEQELSRMKQELLHQKEQLLQLEKSKFEMMREMEEKLANSEQVRNLESNLENLNSELENVSSQLDKAAMELKKEKARHQSVSKHTESIQEKQEALLVRMDEMDCENDALRTQVAELEDIRDQLQENLEKMEKEKSQLEEKLCEKQLLENELKQGRSQLEKSIKNLEEEISNLKEELKESRDNQRLLVEYPDLNSPPGVNITGTGDLAKDMENQLKANSIRIRILQEENNKLHNSVSKMLSKGTSNLMPGKPIPLWKQESLEKKLDFEDSKYFESGFNSNDRQQSFDEAPDNEAFVYQQRLPRPPSKNIFSGRPTSHTDECFIVGRPFTKNSAHRPVSSGKQRRHPGHHASDAESTLSKAVDKSSRTPMQGWIASTAEDTSRINDSFTCPNCDKSYKTRQDMDIHMSYCYGAV